MDHKVTKLVGVFYSLSAFYSDVGQIVNAGLDRKVFPLKLYYLAT